MNAASLAAALAGRRAGRGFSARCPAHDDRHPSLSIRDGVDGKLLVHCHAGCPQARVIEALKGRGLWPQSDRRPAHHLPYDPPVPVGRKPESVDARRSRAALRIWHAAMPAPGTPAEAYLRSRGLHGPIPSALRFHPGLKHSSGSIWPTIVALVTRGLDDKPLAIHRTLLARDGAGKAPVAPQKMMLGPCRGGAARLAPAGTLLMVGEGIETCLAAMQATGQPAWAALSTAGLRALDLPDGVRNVIVLADGDDPGETAARDAALRWRREGRRTRIARPPQGLDFNDMLAGHRPRVEEALP